MRPAKTDRANISFFGGEHEAMRPGVNEAEGPVTGFPILEAVVLDYHRNLKVLRSSKGDAVLRSIDLVLRGIECDWHRISRT